MQRGARSVSIAARLISTSVSTPGPTYIFRIVGGPGDTLQMRDNVLFRNGKRLHEPYVVVTPDVPAVRSFGPVTVPPGHYFFMGDDRDNANDSRFIGFISEEQIRGRLIHVFHIGQCDLPGDTLTPDP